MAVSLLVALAMLGVVCALAETAFFSLSRWQVRQLSLETGGLRASRLLEHPEQVLAALSLVNTLANGLAVVVALAWAAGRGWRLDVTLAGTFLGVLLVSEILPKTVAVRAPVRWAVKTAPAVSLLLRLTRPVRRLAQRAIEGAVGWFADSAQPVPVTDEEYRELLEMAVQQGTLGPTEREIIAELITLDRKCARDVMRPRATMAAVPDDLAPEDLVAAARRARHRRLPMYDETPDTIVGVLDAQRFLLDPEHSLEDAVEFPSFVPETMNLFELFQALQRQKGSLAIALDEFGGVAGVVRMEDILAEVLGDMSGEGTPRGIVFEKLGPGRWRVSGAIRLEDFRREYPGLPESAEFETLGGLLMAQLDIVPEKGQSATVHGLRLTAVGVDERRVRELTVEAVGAR